MASVVRAALNARDLDLSYTMSTGNEAVNGVEDFLEFLLEEDKTRVIALIVEQFRHPRRFLELAARARAKGKPIVLLHPGRSQAARESAATHTGAMAGDYAVMKTLVTHAGVALAENMEELIDLTELMLRCPSVPKRGALIFGESGAFKALMLDVAEDIGLELPEPQGKSREVLAALAPGLILPTNPVDLTAQPLVDPGLYRRALTPLLADDHYNSIVLGLIVSTPSMARTKIGPVYETLRDVPTTKPVIFAMLGEDSEVPADLIADFRSVNVPFFRSPDRAMRALAAFTRYGAQRDAKGAAAATVPQGKRLPAGVIAEHAAKPLLAAAGITVPKSAMARTLTEAEAAAERIGYPVALKAQSAALSHKTDAGGVILRLGDKAALAEGWKRLEANIATAKPGLKLDGVLVEAMAAPGVAELIVGARNDPDWGPVVMLGLGGVFAEALHDARLMPPGLPVEAIVAEIGKLKGAALLRGFRGSPPADVEAAARLVADLGQFVLAHPEVAEIDINPVLVYARGKGVLALDALIVVR